MFRFKLLLSSIGISLLCIGLFCSPAFSATATATVTFITDGTTLMGAENVDVNGALYDVMFIDSTIADLYDGADANSDFCLYSLDGALVTAAAEALLEQVFVGEYAEQPTLINGVNTSDPGSTAAAVVVIPYEYIAENVIATANVQKWSSLYNDNERIGYSSSTSTYDSSPTVGLEDKDDTVISVWSLAETSSVPTPTSILLLGSGLLSIAGLKRKKINKV
ncbi:hypothetical protein [uncultured Desulfobacter sp.]|uniref:hypothetical protein n=1 Tax=uncultured Desulfobacter sp. TaxID=240139 RepID=UPI0029F5919F|nr:hypothetical protein [uncultured Desulfobacter sp.]